MTKDRREARAAKPLQKLFSLTPGEWLFWITWGFVIGLILHGVL